MKLYTYVSKINFDPVILYMQTFYDKGYSRQKELRQARNLENSHSKKAKP